MNLKNLLFVLMILLAPAIGIKGAEINFKGKVSDENSEPLVGATVQTKGSKGTITDLDGYFYLTVSAGATVTVSYVGYETVSLKVPESGELNIVLKPVDSSLDEVVVVGASMKKSDLTGSVSVVDADKLTESPVTTVNEALQGKVAGVFVNTSAKPSDDASIKIRGSNTINSGATPIYVIDGVVMDNGSFGGTFNSVNVNDIASIQVLKDASATALYGSRGANGVVLITTKKGRSNEGHVSYDGWVSFTNTSRRPKTMSAQQLYDLRIDAFCNGYMWNNPDATLSDMQNYKKSIIDSNTDAVFHSEELKTINNGKSYDWLDEMLQTGIQQNHAVSFSKSTNDYNLYLSMNLTDVKGQLIGTHQNKYSVRINADTNIKPWLKVGTNTSYMHQQDKMTDEDAYNKALWANPMIDFSPYKDDATRYSYNGTNWAGEGSFLTVFWRTHTENSNNDYNPFNTLDCVQDRIRSFFTTSNYINIKPVDGLNIRSTFAYNHNTQSYFEFLPDNIAQAFRHHSGDNYAFHQITHQSSWQWDNTVSYDNTFNNHRINAVIGHSAYKSMDQWTYASGERFASNDLTYHKLGGAANIDTKYIDSNFSNYTLLSFFGRLNYNYAGKYYATLTIREDGSSRFNSGHKWGTFPSFSLAWDIANEDFMTPASEWLSRLKIRGGYGVTGNQDIRNFAYLTLYYPKTSNGTAYYETDYLRGSSGLTWERQKQGNVGIDLGLFNNRITMSFDGFFISNENLLLYHILPSTSGYVGTYENIGDLRNNGFEMSINATPIAINGWTWNIGGNLSLDRNKVTKLYGGVERILSGGRTGNIFLNESLNNIYTYRFAGIADASNMELWKDIDFNGKSVTEGDIILADIDGDGDVDQDDRVIAGNSDPKFYGGFYTDLSWKGFTLNAVFSYSYGAKKISEYYENLINSNGLSVASTDLIDRWSIDNPSGKFPKVIDNAINYNRVSPSDCDFSLQDASYLRLSTISLAYNFQPEMLKRLRLSSLRLYASANNVFTITKYKGFDPETGDWGYPPSRSFTVGMNIGF